MLKPTSSIGTVVLGAGAAGLMCAVEAGSRGQRVLLLDHGEQPGRKILISGGGRCNFTNTGTRSENFLGENPHFARSALARFTPADMVALVEKHGIRYHEKTLGQLFCDGSARQIVDLLLRECAGAGVEVRCGTRVLAVERVPPATETAAPRFRLETSLGTLHCRTLVVATGGLSIPKLGATGFGYDLARQFGHRVVEPRPALVPLTWQPTDLAGWSDLAGISFEVCATAGGDRLQGGAPRGRARASAIPSFREKLLLTHRGLSGPAGLQASSYWHPGTALTLDLIPKEVALLGPLRARPAGRSAATLGSLLKQHLPARFAERWVDLHAGPGTDWSNAGLDRLEARLHRWQVTPAGTEGFAKAEVTAGGVDTAELDSRTMESRRVPGLHFVGEVVDITGWLGGYNFQWAWASAAACGRSL